MQQMEIEVVEEMTNYVVTGAYGTPDIKCSTVEEVWGAIGNKHFGAIYQVHSPKGLDVSEFVPF